MGSNRSYSWSFIFGALIVAAGVVLLLDQQGIINADRVFSYFWPVVMIAFGSVMLIDCRGRGGRGIWGMTLLAIGAVLVLENLGVAHIRFGTIWPLIVIGVGILMIWQAAPRISADGAPRPQWPEILNRWSRTGSPDADFNGVAILGGFKRRITSKKFKGGSVLSVMGGFQIDLRQAGMEGDTAIIEAMSFMGGGEIKIPDDWLVSMEGMSLFGAFVDETDQQTPAVGGTQKRLIMKGVSLMGGIVVKN
jgi:cell wall-active antibiotic response 4TMS protein YvqF